MRAVPYLLAVVLPLGLVGCTETSMQTKGGATTAPASRPRSAPADPKAPSTAPALPPRATVELDDLTPPVAPPTDRAYDRPLNDKAKALMGEARALRKKNDIPGAIDKLTKALSYDPNNPAVHRLLGLTYVALPNHGKAVEHLSRAAKYMGDDVAMQVILGKLAMLRRDPQAAILHYRRALKCSDAKPENPETAYAMLHLARLLQQEGYWTAALKAWDQLQWWSTEAGSAWQKEKQLRELLVYPERMLRAKGRLLLLLRRYDQAAHVLLKAYQRNRSDFETAQLLLTAQMNQQAYDQAESLLLDLAGQKGAAGSMVPTLAEQLCLRSGQSDMPLRIWKAYRARNEVWGSLALALARAAEGMNQDNQAREILLSLLGEMPENDEAISMLARLYVRNDAPLKAFNRLAELLAESASPRLDARRGVQTILAASDDPEQLLRQAVQSAGQAPESQRHAGHYLAALLAEETGKEYLAADQYRKALEAREDFLRAYVGLVGLSRSAVPAVRIQQLLEQAKNNLQTDGDYAYLKGLAELNRGQLDEAIDDLQIARQQRPNHLPTLLTLANAYQLQARQTTSRQLRNLLVRKADQILSKALQLAPQRSVIYRQLFQLAIARQDFPKARQIATRLAETLPSKPDGRLLLAELYLVTGQADQADQLIALLNRQFPDRLDIRLLAIRSQIGRYAGVLPKDVCERAIDQLNRLLNEQPDDPAILRMLAELLSRPVPGRFADAALLWGRLWDLDPDDLTVAQTYALVLTKAEQFEYAVGVLEQLLEKHPGNAVLRGLLLDALTKADQGDAAVELARKWYRQDPDQGDGLVLLLGVLELQKRYASAIERIDQQLERTANEALKQKYQVEKLNLLCKAGRFDQAVRIAKASDSIPLVYLVSVRLMEQEQYDASIELLRSALQREGLGDDQREGLRSQLVLVYDRMGQTDQALTLIQDWLGELDAMDPRPSDYLARQEALRTLHIRTLISAGRYDQATSQLDAYLKDDPNNADFYNLRATLLGEAGQTDQAIAALEKALQLAEGDAGLQNNLAYSLADANRQIDRAERLIGESLKHYFSQGLQPPVANQDTQAWVYYKQGKLSRAGSIFQSILRGDDDSQLHPVILDHAGDTFYRLGWVEQAIDYWQRAMDLADDLKDDTTREVRTVRQTVPPKIQAARAGQDVSLAPMVGGGDAQTTGAPNEQPQDVQGE